MCSGGSRPVFDCSGFCPFFAGGEIVNEALKVGAAEVLSKTFGRSALREVLNSCLASAKGQEYHPAAVMNTLFSSARASLSDRRLLNQSRARQVKTRTQIFWVLVFSAIDLSLAF
jgi:DNA-binding NarL/FixJ family response regulator